MTEAPIPDDVRHYVYKRDGARCQRCQDRRNLELDHLYPRHLLRAHRVPSWQWHFPENLQLLCHDCNERKGVTAPTKAETEALYERDLEYRMKDRAFKETIERHPLILLFGDLVQDECERRGSDAPWEKMESIHLDWRERLYNYVLHGAEEELVYRAATKAIANANDIWAYASTIIRSELGIAFDPNEVKRARFEDPPTLFERSA